MPNFDLDTVLRARASVAQAGTAKLQEVLQARQAKAAEFNAQNSTVLNPIDPYQDSWVRQLGMNPETLQGEVVNLGANLFSGAARVAGDIASLPFDIGAIGDEAGLTELDHAAYGRWLRGEATDEDQVRLNTRDMASGLSPMERYARAQGNRETASGIDRATDFGSTIHGANRDALTRQLQEGFADPWSQVTQGWERGGLSGAVDVASGLAQLAGHGVKAAVQNPLGAAEFVAENVPQLGLALVPGGQVALGASNLGYGAELYRKGIENHQRENQGAYPDADTRERMGWMAAAAAGAEQVGDLATLKLGGQLGKIAGEVDTKALRQGLKQSLKNVGKAFGEGTVSEAATEGFQTYAEGQAQLDPATAAEIYAGAVVGGIVGGGMAGGLRTAAELTGATPEAEAARAVQAKKALGLAQAIEQGDPSAYTDPKSADYDPIQAAFVLHQYAKREDVTPEQRQQKFDEALKLVETLGEQFEGADAEKVKDLTAKQKILFEKLYAFKADKAKLDAAAPLPKAEEVQAVVSAATGSAATPEEVAPAAKQVMSLAMRAPDSITPEQALAVANAADNGLTDQERAFLRTFSEARAAENALKSQGQVNDEVLNGGRGNIGINQYRERFELGLDAGNAGIMNQQIKALDQFLSSHQAKAEVAAKALADAQAISPRNDGFYVLRSQDGTWFAKPADGSMNKTARNKVGALHIHPGSTKLVQGIQAEARAIELARNEMTLARDLKLGVTGTGTQPAAAVAPAQVSQPASSTPEGTAAAAPSVAAAAPAPAPADFTAIFDTDELFNRWSNTRTADDRPNMTRLIQGVAKTLQPFATEANRAALRDELMGQKWFKQATPEQQEAGVNALIAANQAAAPAPMPEPVAKAAPGFKWGSAAHVANAQTGTDGIPDFKGKVVVRQPAAEEMAALAPELEKIARVFGKEVDATDFLVHDDPDTLVNGLAHPAWEGTGAAVSVSSRLLNDPKAVGEVLAHELAHTWDQQDSTGDIWLSDSLPRYQPGGEFWEAVKGAKNKAIRRMFRQVFADLPEYRAGHKPGRELFAQLHALYLTQPELMRSELKDVYVKFEQVHQVYGDAQALAQEGEVGQGVDGQRAGDGTGRGREAGQEPARGQPAAQGAAGAARDAAAPEGLNQDANDDLGDIEALVSAVEARGAAVPSATPEASTEPAEPALTEQDAAPAGELKGEGKLSLFSQRLKAEGMKLAELWKQPGFNPLAQFLKQSPTSETALTRRPLVAVKDFFEQLKDKGFIKKLASLNLVQGELTIEQEMALQSLATKANQWIPQLQSNLRDYDQVLTKGGKPLHQDFKIQDVMQYLLLKDEQGNTVTEVENNVAGAMAAGMYSWILDRANAPAWLTSEQVNKMHGKDKDTPLAQGAMAELGRLHAFEGPVIDQLGGLAVSMLGIKEDKDAPQDLLPRLKNALGSHMLLALEANGYIERVHKRPQQVERYFPPKDHTDENEEGAEDANPYAGESMYRYVQFVHQFEQRKDGRGRWVNTPDVQAMKAVNQGTGGIVDKLLASERKPRIAPTEPMPFTQQFAKGTNQRIPKKLAAVLEKTQQVPHYAIPEMLTLLTGLGREGLLKAAGWVEPDETKISARNLDSVQAQNDNLENQLDLMLEMWGAKDGNEQDVPADVLKQRWFVTTEVWKNFRAGFTSQSLNQQTSKIHRVMMAREGWEAEIDLLNQDQVNEFLISAYMNLGLKTDAQPNVQTLAKIATWLDGEPKLKQALEIVKAGVVRGDAEVWTAANQQLVGEAAAKAEGMLTLQALVALAKFEAAKEDMAKGGASTVKVHMLVGSDGKTNGPMLTHFALGAAGNIDDMFDLLNRGGFYSTAENQAQHFSQWKATPDANGKKALDLYEHLASLVLARMREKLHTLDEIKAGWRERKRLADMGKMEAAGAQARMVATWFTPEQYRAVEIVTKQLQSVTGEVVSAGRNLVKTPLTGFAFGSALKGSVQSMAGKFVDTIFDDIEELARGTRKDGVTLKDLLGAVNVLIELGGGKANKLVPRLDENMAIEEALKLKLLPGKKVRGEDGKLMEVPSQEEAIMAGFNKVVGNSTMEAMESAFRVFIDRRKALNKAIQAGFHTYETAYQTARAALVQELMERGEIAYRESKAKDGTVTREPLHDLSVDQERILRERLSDVQPVANTAYSQEEGNLAAGVFLAKKAKQQSKSPIYKNKVYVAHKVHNLTPEQDTQTGELLGKTEDFLDSTSQVKVSVDPGVAGTPYLTHSLDSFGMHSMLDEIYQGVDGANPLNVHDEASTSYVNIAGVAQSLNKNIAQALLDFSPARQALDMMERQLTGLAARIKEGSVPKEAAVHLRKAWAAAYNRGMPAMQHIEPEYALDFVAGMAASNAYEADKLRLLANARLGVVDQYTWEGGQWQPDEQFHQTAVERLVQLEVQGDKPSQELTDAIAFLDQVAEGADPKLLDYSAWLDASEDENQDTPDAGPRAKSAAWLGVPGVNAADVVEDLFQRQPAHAGLKAVRASLAQGMGLTRAIDSLPEIQRSQVIEMVARAAQDRPQERFNPWGEVGTPVRPGNARLIGFLSQERDVSVEQLAPVLEAALKADSPDGPFSKFNLLLLRQLAKVAPKDLRIKWVTPETPATDILEAPLERSRGWTVARPEGRTEVYVLSPEFRHSAVEPELLLHELVHGVLGRVIAQAHSGKGNPESQSLVQELDALRAQVEEFLNGENQQSLNAQFAPAVANVQELVSWGLTNQAFQQEVLAKLQVRERDNRPGTNSLVDWMGAFIKKVLALLFPGDKTARNKQAHNGLTVLVSNAAGLIAQVKAERQWPTGQDAAFNLSQAVPGSQGPVDKAFRFTVEQLFDALGQQPATGRQVSAEFAAKLKGTLGMVQQLFGAGGVFKANAMSQVAMTPLDVWAKAQTTGELPFTSRIPAQLALHPQEQFVIEQIEATVRAALEDNESRTAIAYGELAKLYKEAHDTLKRSDFADPALYDFLFGVESRIDGRSAYLARFAALGLGHQDINALLGAARAGSKQPAGELTFEQRLKSFVAKVLDWFAGKVTKTRPGEPMSQALAKLTGQLVDIEAKKRLRVARDLAGSPVTGAFAALEQAAKDTAEKAKRGIAQLADSEIVKSSKTGVVKGAAAITKVVVNDQVKEFTEAAFRLRDEALKKRHGWIAGLVNELKGLPDDVQLLINAVKRLEQQRKERITDTSKAVLSAFEDGGAKLTGEDKTAITQVFLRTGAHVLLGDQGMERIRKVLAEDAARGKEIQTVQAALAQYQDQFAYFVGQAKDLGLYKAQGLVKGDFVLMNAGNIARLTGTKLQGSLSQEQVDAAEVLIDQLATLYALEYLAPEQRQRAAAVLDREMARGDGGNGVEMVLKVHKTMEQEARARLFDGTEALAMKGYTPEIYNHHTAIAVARDEDEAAQLEAQGYSLAGDLEQDPADPHGKDVARLYVLKDGGLQARVTGAMGLTGQAAKGTKLYGGKNNFFDPDALQNMLDMSRVTKARQPKIDALLKRPLSYDPRKVKGNRMAPVLNGSGEIRGWRYLMNEATKDAILERDNRPEAVLGALAGSVFDKETTPVHNRQVVQALKDLYDQDYAKRPGSYARISARSPDPDLRELYRLMPDQTQDMVRAIWGKEGMMVPYELLDAVFGYRKLTLSTAFEKDAAGESLNMAEKALVESTRGLLYAVGRARFLGDDEARKFAQRGGVYLRRMERAWQEIVKEFKDIVVVKSGVTMIGNIKSNVSFLLFSGVPIKEIAHHHRVAIRGALAYQRDRAALAQLELKLSSGYTRGDEEELQRQAAILQDSIARNPVHELIEAGMMPTIVEDVAVEDDPYSYKSQLERKVQGLTDKVNPTLLKVGKYAYMTHDTPLYQSLSQITQLSDFVARYTLYQHMISRKENRLSKKEAMARAVESFISYDVPMQRGLQYMDDMGFMTFTKYVLRIQRVLARLVKEHPARVLMGLLLGRYFDNLDMVIEGSWLHRIGSNPLDAGALQYPFVFDELATSRAALSLIK